MADTITLVAIGDEIIIDTRMALNNFNLILDYLGEFPGTHEMNVDVPIVDLDKLIHLIELPLVGQERRLFYSSLSVEDWIGLLQAAQYMQLIDHKRRLLQAEAIRKIQSIGLGFNRALITSLTFSDIIRRFTLVNADEQSIQDDNALLDKREWDRQDRQDRQTIRSLLTSKNATSIKNMADRSKRVASHLVTSTRQQGIKMEKEGILARRRQEL